MRTELGKKIEVGTLVKISDGSYNLCLKRDGSLEGVLGLALDSGQFVVVATGLTKLPADHSCGATHCDPEYLYNDTIIRHVHNGRIVFVNHRCLSRVDYCEKGDHTLTHCPSCHKELGFNSHCSVYRGDKVKIRDGSFIKMVSWNGKIENLPYDVRNTEEYVIVAMNMENLPTDNDNHWKGITNDTIIKGVNSGRIIFIRADQLTFIKLCSHCGSKL